MDFLAIQNAVIADRFDEGQRSQVKDWINYRYSRIWGAENWNFKISKFTQQVAAGVAQFTKAPFYGDIISIQDATNATTYTKIHYLQPEFFYDVAQTNQSGLPYYFTIIAGVVYFDRPMDTTRNLTVIANQPFVPLVNDSALAIPTYDPIMQYLLVVGATAEGLRRENDPAWEAEEAAFDKGMEDLRREWLFDAPGDESYPSWP